MIFIISHRSSQKLFSICDPLTPIVLVDLWLGVGEELGLGVGLGNQLAISTRGVIIWQGINNGHNTVHMSGRSYKIGAIPF